MAARGKDGRKQRGHRAAAPGGSEFPRGMGGGEVGEMAVVAVRRGRAIATIRPPSPRALSASRQKDDMAAPPRQASEGMEAGAALRRRKMVMAEYEARTARQAAQGAFQPGIVARIRHKPQARQGVCRQGLARAHGAAIAAP